MTAAARTPFSIALAVKRLERRKRRDKVLQALHQVATSRQGITHGPLAGPRAGASIHDIHKALPELQHAQIGRELQRACAQLAVEVVAVRGPRKTKIWNLSKCQACGCDELHACSDDGEPCSWVSLNLCSRCAP